MRIGIIDRDTASGKKPTNGRFTASDTSCYTYTTEQPFTVNVDGERFKVSCVVEGVGTNLFGYRVYMSKRLRIPLSELKFRSVKAEDGEKFLKIDSLSLHNAISVRLSDIKVISVGSVPEIPDPRQQEK